MGNPDLGTGQLTDVDMDIILVLLKITSSQLGKCALTTVEREGKDENTPGRPGGKTRLKIADMISMVWLI